MLKSDASSTFSSLKSPGTLLKSARLSLDYSLEEIAKISKVPLYALHAIEHDDWEALPGLIYVKGFLKLYAREVHLDPEYVIEVLNASFIENLAYEEMKVHEAWGEEDYSSLNIQALMSLMAGVAVAVLIVSLFGVNPQTLEAKEAPKTVMTSTLP